MKVCSDIQIEQVWLIGIINNITKEFRKEGTHIRDSYTLKKFILKYVPKGNYIVTDGWAGYFF